VVRRQRDQELLAQRQVAPFDSRRLVSGIGRVLERHGEVQLARSDPRRQVCAPFVHGDPRGGEPESQARDGGRHQPRQRGREGADAQSAPLLVRELGDLRACEREALGDDVGVLEQDRSRGGELEATGLAAQESHAGLALEGGDLVGHRRLRQREPAGGAGERALVRDGPEGQHAFRVHSSRLSICANDDLKLWHGRATLTP
jgi:hypothetical protein